MVVVSKAERGQLDSQLLARIPLPGHRVQDVPDTSGPCDSSIFPTRIRPGNITFHRLDTNVETQN